MWNVLRLAYNGVLRCFLRLRQYIYKYTSAIAPDYSVSYGMDKSAPPPGLALQPQYAPPSYNQYNQYPPPGGQGFAPPPAGYHGQSSSVVVVQQPGNRGVGTCGRCGVGAAVLC